MPATCKQRAAAHVSVENQWRPADGSHKATALEMVELAVPADDTCLSRLIEQPLEARAVEQPDDGPSHRRELGQQPRHGFWRARRRAALPGGSCFVHPTFDDGLFGATRWRLYWVVGGFLVI